MAFYSSYGGAGEVTGSCHLLEIGHIKILIDCGLFQGHEEKLNYEKFGFDPKDINYLIVTHAHLDHIGRIPLLVKEGFNKQIITTQATYEIAKLMLKNSAGILQEKEEPLYTLKDVEPALNLFDTFLEYDQRLELEENISITLKNAGHILGSSTLKIEYVEDGLQKSAIFSGDIGQSSRIITSEIDFWEEGNYVFLESTYGDRNHPNLELCIENFKEKILNTLHNDGVVVLPSFALERTQELLFILKSLSDEKKLQNIPVYLDSPLAIEVTKTFEKFPHLFNQNIQDIIKDNQRPFYFKELIQTYSKEESIQINSVNGKKIIIAGSGMCEGGRVKYHLSRYLNDKKNLILFVGYQVKGTLGNKILSQKQSVTIDNNEINIKASVDCIDGFSAHADQDELLAFIEHIKNIYCINLIHGDATQLKSLKDKISKQLHDKVHIVKMKEKIYI